MHQSKIAKRRFRLHRLLRAVLAGLLAASGSAWVAQAAAAATFSFQEGISGYAGTADTYLSESLPAKVRGAEQMLWLDTANPNGTGNSETVLIRFDGIFETQGGPIPLGSQITSATLTYTISDPGFPRRSNIYELLVDWSESVTYQDFAGDGIPGVQPAEYGSFVSKVPVPVGTSTINVTDSLTSWSADPSSNKGWVVLPDNSDLVRLWSSEATDPNLRPLLTVVIDEGPPTGELVRHPYLQLGTPTSMNVVWETDLPSDSMVHYGLSPSSLDLWALQASPDTQHVITLTGLSPETKYYYDVGTATRVLAGGDADHYFVTSPPVGASTPSRVWIVGDSGTGGTRQAQVRDAMLAHAGVEVPNIFLHLGDMAYPDGSDSQFTDHFFSPYRTILRNTVVWPTIGAHESVLSDNVAETGPYYESYVLPSAGEAGGVSSGREAYYSFDFGNVHFISLNFFHAFAQSPMWDWLLEDVGATEQAWLIAFIAYPPYSKGNHDSDLDESMTWVREQGLPILEAAGVDLVIAGHSHIYERSFLIDGAYDTPTTAGGHIVDSGDGRPSGDGVYTKPPGLNPHQGTVYVVSGNGGTSISGAGGHPVMFFDELAWGSVLLTIDDQLLSLSHIRSDGVVSDSFQIAKVNHVPAMRSWLRMSMAMLVLMGGMFLLRGNGKRGAPGMTEA